MFARIARRRRRRRNRGNQRVRQTPRRTSSSRSYSYRHSMDVDTRRVFPLNTKPLPAIRRPSLGQRASSVIVHQRVIPGKVRRTRTNILRAELHPQECRARKAYKKTMLKQIAAQHRARGRGSLQNWRRKRRLESTHIQYRC